MPRQRRPVVGKSEHTVVKLDHYATVIDTEMLCLRNIIRKNHRRSQPWAEKTIWYVELNSGPGYYEDLGRAGSPLLAIAAAQRYELPTEAHLCEKDRGVHARLVDALQKYGGLLIEAPNTYGGVRLSSADGLVTVQTYRQDYRAVVPRLIRWHLNWWNPQPDGQKMQRFGLVFSDETGKVLPLGELQLFAERMPRMDLLTYTSGTNLKRQYRHPDVPWYDNLDTCLQTIGKPDWLIRTPVGAHQWTFLLGTSWPQFPEQRGIGLYLLRDKDGRSSPEGVEAMRLLNEAKEPPRRRAAGDGEG